MSERKGTASDFDVKLGKRIRLLRTEKSLTQSALAKNLDVTFQQVQKYENGTNRVTVQKLVRIAEALDMPCSYILETKKYSSLENNDQYFDDAMFSELLKSWNKIESKNHKKAILRFMKSLANAN